MFGFDWETQWGGVAYLLRRRAIMKVAKPCGVCLDIGCGDGRHCRELLKRGCTYYVGLDIDRDSIKKAKASYSNQKADFIVADGRYLPIVSESMDFALATEVLEHVENYVQVAQEIQRVIKRDGCLVVTIPSLTIGKLLLAPISRLVRGKYVQPQDNTHKREFCKLPLFRGLESLQELKNVLRSKGFIIVLQRSADVVSAFDLILSRLVAGMPERHQTLAWLTLKVDESLAKILKNWGNYTILQCKKPSKR